MKHLLIILSIILFSVTITSCGGSRMSDAYLPVEEGDINTLLLLVAIGICVWIYNKFKKDD